MPRFDGTGPMGQGPRTGRGMGNCLGVGGCGRGFGFRNFYTKKEETEILKDEQIILEEELKAIKERLADISKDQK